MQNVVIQKCKAYLEIMDCFAVFCSSAQHSHFDYNVWLLWFTYYINQHWDGQSQPTEKQLFQAVQQR
jgi:hypothetical protein